MDASDLRIFETVARLGGMNRAAAELNTVQSNVTARIRALEVELEVELFRRNSRGVELTAAGKRLLPYAKRIAQLFDEARQAARDDGMPHGPLLIGALETTTALRLSSHFASFIKAFPEVDLTLRTGTSRELIDAVLDRRYEGAFVCGPVDHPDLHSETMFDEELVILAAPDVSSMEDYLKRTEPRIIVLRAGCSYRLILEGWLARHGTVGVRQLEFGTLEAIIGCVSAGLGVTLLPKALIGTVWKQGQVSVHFMRDGEGHIETVFVRRKDDRMSSALDALLAHLRPGFAQLQAAE